MVLVGRGGWKVWGFWIMFLGDGRFGMGVGVRMESCCVGFCNGGRSGCLRLRRERIVGWEGGEVELFRSEWKWCGELVFGVVWGVGMWCGLCVFGSI